MSLQNFNKKNKTRGFTLIELVVVVTIMLIMTTVVFFNYNSFNDSMLLNNFAYDLSLTIRQAQLYGIAVKEAPGATVSGQIGSDGGGILAHSNFSSAYGLHFSTKNIGDNTSFNLFLDEPDTSNGNPPSGFYESTTDLSLQTYSFQRGITIKEICVGGGTAGGNSVCGSTVQGGGGTQVTSLDITFLRPDPQAIISAVGANNFKVCDPSNGGNFVCGSATIVLQNANGSLKKAVVVSSTGQISVQSVQ